jgi:tetratricopeptide (TPR) repeat protein
LGLVRGQQLRILYTMKSKIRQYYFRTLWLATLPLMALMVAACTTQKLDNNDLPVVDEAAAEQPLTTEDEAEELREPTSEDVMYHVFAAELLGSEGNLEAAVGEYLEAALESNDPEIARRATQVAFAAQAWLQAAMAADRWALLDPDELEAHESATTSMLLTGDYAGAELQLQQIIELKGNTAESWILVASLLAQSSDAAKATALLENLLLERGDPKSADAMFAQSHLAARFRDLKRAYELAKRAVELDPERVEFLTWAGRLALNLNNIAAGLRYIERSWKQAPEDHDIALAYADLLFRTQRIDEARQVMEDMEQTPDVLFARVMFEIKAQESEQAENLFREFEEMKFDDSNEASFFQAQAAEALGMIPRAIELYAKVESGERAVVAGIRGAELMAAEGDVEAARRKLARIRLQTNAAIVEESWLVEARILRDIRDSKGALEALDKALEQLPGSINIRYSHALLAAELGWVDIAETDLRSIIAEQPENAAALNALGYTLADRTERFEEAEALIRQAFILRPDDASIVDSMGWISYRLGNLEDSEKYLRRAWALDNNPEIAAHLGEVLWVIGNKEDALSIWREGMKVDSDNPVLLETLQRMEVEL